MSQSRHVVGSACFAHADYNGIVLEISLWFSPPMATFE
jgi:hypothetical protein